MNTRHLLTLAATILCSVTFAEDKKPGAVQHVDANAAEEMVKEGRVIILDVRTPDEHKEGHIAGSKVIDFTENDFAEKVAALDRGKSYLVHCASGGRSTNSLEVFQKLGFKSIYHLDGGFNAWVKGGKPVEK